MLYTLQLHPLHSTVITTHQHHLCEPCDENRKPIFQNQPSISIGLHFQVKMMIDPINMLHQGSFRFTTARIGVFFVLMK